MFLSISNVIIIIIIIIITDRTDGQSYKSENQVVINCSFLWAIVLALFWYWQHHRWNVEELDLERLPDWCKEIWNLRCSNYLYSVLY